MNNTDFWANIDGAPEHAYTSSFKPIPDGTVAVAEIKSAEYMQPEGKTPYYEFTWRIVSEEFKGRMLFQKVRCFEEDEAKSTRARNLLLLLFKLANVSVPSGMPGNADVAHFQGRILKIQIKYKKFDDRDVNWVSEVYPSDFVPEPVAHIESAMSRNSRVAPAPNDADIPF